MQNDLKKRLPTMKVEKMARIERTHSYYITRKKKKRGEAILKKKVEIAKLAFFGADIRRNQPMKPTVLTKTRANNPAEADT